MQTGKTGEITVGADPITIVFDGERRQIGVLHEVAPAIRLAAEVKKN